MNTLWAVNQDLDRTKVWPMLPRLNRTHSELSAVKSATKKSELFNAGNVLEEYAAAEARARQRFEIVTDSGSVGADVANMDIKTQVNFITGLLLKQFHMSEIGFVVPLVTTVLETLGNVPMSMSLVWDLLENPTV